MVKCAMTGSNTTVAGSQTLLPNCGKQWMMSTRNVVSADRRTRHSADTMAITISISYRLWQGNQEKQASARAADFTATAAPVKC